MRIAVLPGDDIGPEIVTAALTVLRVIDERFELGLEFELHEVGMAAHRRVGTTLPDAVIEATHSADGVLLGPGGMTNYPSHAQGGINIPGTIRKQLDLFANIRPARSRGGLARALKGLDCVIVRENTQGFYADRNMYAGQGEFMPTPDCALAVRLITREACRRIAQQAFAVAMRRRKLVTVVGKRHVLQLSDGIFVEETEAVGRDFPEVALREMDVDAMAADLYMNPDGHDVILTTNMFGDILSNLVVAFSGGLGLAASLNVGDGHAAANAGHGSAPDIAGRGIANPVGIILSSAMLLRWWSERSGKGRFDEAACAIEKAVDAALEQPGSRTRDLGGDYGTEAFAEHLVSLMYGEWRERTHQT